jgi:enamine deaminase RidA (YjgF/YER057c/UK114 family)
VRVILQRSDQLCEPACKSRAGGGLFWGGCLPCRRVALDAHKVVGAGDPAAQTRQVFENLRRCLAAADATFDHVVKLTYYITDVGCLPVVRAVRDEYIDTNRPPASTAVQVAALFRPELLLEVEAFALLPEITE